MAGSKNGKLLSKNKNALAFTIIYSPNELKHRICCSKRHQTLIDGINYKTKMRTFSFTYDRYD